MKRYIATIGCALAAQITYAQTTTAEHQEAARQEAAHMLVSRLALAKSEQAAAPNLNEVLLPIMLATQQI